ALALGSYPGFTLTGPPAKPTPYGVYRAAYVDRDVVVHTVVHGDGRREVIADRWVSTGSTGEGPSTGEAPSTDEGPSSEPRGSSGVEALGPTYRRPLGTFVHARSGDKGGDANIGLWVSRTEATGADQYAARHAWLRSLITPEQVRRLLPEAESLPIEVHDLPNLGAVNVLARGLLGQGVAASTRFDPQAKAVGEWLRARHVDIPEELV